MEQLIQTIMDSARIIDRPNGAEIVACIGSSIAAIASIAAIIVAANVAKKQNDIAKEQVHIADEQNKIALFEKRHEYYELMLKMVSFNSQLSNLQVYDQIIIGFFVTTFGEERDAIPDNEPSKRIFLFQLWGEIFTTLQRGKFLFDIANLSHVVERLCMTLMNIVLSCEDPLREEELVMFVERYQNYVEQAEKDIIPQIENYLKLSSLKG